jgi:DNA-binding NtrC family response regulator
MTSSNSLDLQALVGVTILVVDDDPLLRVATSATLRGGRHHAAVVLEADSIRAACKVVHEVEGRLDAVVLDSVAPGGDLGRVLEALAEYASGPGVVLFTGVGEVIAVREGARLRADRIVLKPASPNMLVSAVVQALEAARARRIVVTDVPVVGSRGEDPRE